uniref:MULE domain-containing protein n=1 Tax=Rhabditophanes sp. KR3021 TaxID=114890 RepID=A0AC35TGA9_9BILA
MKGKTKEMYQRIFGEIDRLAEKLRIVEKVPNIYLTDKENAVISIIEARYKNAFSDCYFHYCQTIMRKVNTLGLMKLTKQINRIENGEENMRSFYYDVRRILALPLLPLRLMSKHYSKITESMTRECRS